MPRRQLCYFDVSMTAINTTLHNMIFDANLLNFVCLKAVLFNVYFFAVGVWRIPRSEVVKQGMGGKTSHFLVLNVNISKR